MNTVPKTLRLLMPQWQGGNNPPYSFGARLLAWLAPESGSPLVEVPVTPYAGEAGVVEEGIFARNALIAQLKEARRIIDAQKPDRIAVFGGDCLVSLAPFAYLNERYGGQMGVLWIDAHPDVSTPKDFCNAHAMVLGNLLGEGDPQFTREVKLPVSPGNVMLAGLQKTLAYESATIRRLNLKSAAPGELSETSRPVLDWLAETGLKHIAIHLDLDVLDPRRFRSLLFANPDAAPDAFEGISMGEMTMPQLARLVRDVSERTDVVGLAIAEHLPWDAINLKNMLAGFPILGV